jgi:hypothetical protein
MLKITINRTALKLPQDRCKAYWLFIWKTEINNLVVLLNCIWRKFLALDNVHDEAAMSFVLHHVGQAA